MSLKADITPRRRCGGVPDGLRSILIAVALALGVCAPALSQGTKPRDPPPEGPWSGRRGGDPTDTEAQAEGRRKKAQECYEAGVKLLERKQIQAAKAKFRAAIELVGTEGAGQAALSQLTQIHAEGMQQFEKANALFQEGKFLEAIALAKKTKVLYAGILDGMPGGQGKPNIAQLAVKLIKLIETDPQAKGQIQEQEAGKRYARIGRLKEAAQKDETKYYDLYKALKNIAKKCPDCPTGKKCAEEVQKIRADKKVYAAVKKEEQRRFIASTLAAAERYEKAGQTDLAAAEYQKLKAEFPGTSLDELRRMAQEGPGGQPKPASPTLGKG